MDGGPPPGAGLSRPGDEPRRPGRGGQGLVVTWTSFDPEARLSINCVEVARQPPDESVHVLVLDFIDRIYAGGAKKG